MNKKPSSVGPKVSSLYFGMSYSQGQDPDEPYDIVQQQKALVGGNLQGRGSQGGGSKPTPQTKITTTGSAFRGHKTIQTGSYPRSPQKLRT